MVFIASSWFPVDGRRGGTGIGLNHWCDWYYVVGLVLIGAPSPPHPTLIIHHILPPTLNVGDLCCARDELHTGTKDILARRQAGS